MTVTQSFFRHDQIRKYVTAFGTLFNSIHVQRTDSDGNTLHLEQVPLTYAPKAPFIYKINQDPNLDQKPAIKLPRMAFELVNIDRDSSRSRHSSRKTKINTSNTDHTFTYTPVPVTLEFELTIGAKTQTEMFQIVEQIIPFFDPDYAVTMHVVDDAESTFDAPIQLNSNSPDDTYQGSFDENRAITWVMSFTMHAYLFGPVHKSAVIRQAITEFYWLNTDKHTHTLTIEPTLGDGTPIEDIKPSDDFNIDSDLTYE